ncbi:MAG: 50S ribosomal protein L21 [Paracoccaceae bacterium]|nr:50S ribosomal protein L21 [Paracoccaceae bacterium]
MFAVLKTGGKQYKVSQNDVIIVEKLSAESGALVQFDHIMMIGDKKVEVGTPVITGAAVHAEVLEQAKSKKVTSFVKRRRKHSSQRTRGHRQNVTVLRVKEILSSGAENSGDKIEVGVTLIKSSTKTIKKPTVKAETAKKPTVKAETAKKPAVKAETAKKPTVKAETAKKPTVKAETAKKPLSKVKGVKKPVATKKN